MPSTTLQINLTVPNVPGSLALLSDKLKAANVNIEGLFCEEGPKFTTVHLIVDDTETAKLVLKPLYECTTTPVLAIQEKNNPGTIAHIARMLAGASINIHHIYATASGKRDVMVFMAVSDIEKAKKVLS